MSEQILQTLIEEIQNLSFSVHTTGIGQRLFSGKNTVDPAEIEVFQLL